MTARLLETAAVVLVVALVASRILSTLFGRWGLVAVPNSRSLHSTPTPVGVGVVVPALVAGAVVVVEHRLPATVVCLLAFAVLGFMDDVANLGAPVRLVAQAVIALLGVLSLGDLDVGYAVLAVVVVVAAVNGLNFMDGINGITASLGIVLGLTLVLMGHHIGSDTWQTVGCATAAACLGYLPDNFPTARSFPGDVLPYSLAATFTLGLADMVRISPVLALGVGPLVPAFIDTSTTLARRARHGEGLMTAHRDHAYQRLTRRTSHTRATLTFLGLSLLGALALPVGLLFGTGIGVAFLVFAAVCCFLVLRRVPQDAG
jgi:UDP-GlcNAc:undecaprenyl-phosphate/decaprenyl-phosphate GlcNAc-1-phosphate transferase